MLADTQAIRTASLIWFGGDWLDPHWGILGYLCFSFLSLHYVALNYGAQVDFQLTKRSALLCSPNANRLGLKVWATKVIFFLNYVCWCACVGLYSTFVSKCP